MSLPNFKKQRPEQEQFTMALAKLFRMGVSLSLCGLLGSGIAMAQSPLDAGGVNNNQQETREYYELLQKERQEAEQSVDTSPLVEDEAVPEAPASPAESRRILITGFEVSPSEVLTPEQIAAVTDPYVNTELNIGDIQGVVAEINQLYAAESRIVARAVLPKQNVSDGIIKIDLIEAKLGGIQVTGNEHTRTSFIENRVAAEPGELVKLDELEQSLLEYNRVNDMTLRASLSPGDDYGTTDVVILAQEPQNVTVNAYTDNAGRDTVGQNRVGFSAQVKSLFGFRDRLSLGSTWAEGTLNGYGSYDIPVHSSGTRVGAFFDRGDIEIIKGPLSAPGLDVTGDSSDAGLSVTQPIMIRQTFDWDGSLRYTHKTSDSYFADEKVASTQADLFALGTNLRFFDASGTWLTYHVLAYGESDSVQGRDYLIYNGSLIRLQYWQNGSSLLFRSSWQLSDTNELPSFDQLVIGGVATVRGYSEGILAGDQGYTASVEYAYPMNFLGDWAQRKNIFVFLDHGAAIPFRGDNGPDSKSEDFITSTGLGLDFDMWKAVSFKIALGIPLNNNREFNQDDYKIHAIFNWNVW